MKALRYENRRLPSSDASRSAARVELEVVRARLAEIASQQKSARQILEPLVAAARFVLDMRADPPSLDRLAAATTEAEGQAALAEEYAELRCQKQTLEARSGYYQWQAVDYAGCLPMVVAQADTRAELAKKISAAGEDDDK